MVLLRRSFYTQGGPASLQSLAAEWLCFFLLKAAVPEGQPPGGAALRQLLMRYLVSGEAAAIAMGPELRAQLPEEEARMLVNLGRDWIITYLPHCLSKIDRVRFGLLQQRDLDRADATMAEARKFMAVPFTGRICPGNDPDLGCGPDPSMPSSQARICPVEQLSSPTLRP